LILHLPALIAFGFARDLATPQWLAIYAVAVVAECVALRLLWRALGDATGKVAGLASDLGEAERARIQLAAEKQQITGELLVSLARRNQALLHRQLSKIDEMEAREQDPTTLSQLFAVDHLATRMRRNAESLLVLSGEESVRKLTRPTPMSEVIRGAVAEIEDYQRVDITMNGDADVVGRAVVDVVHLLAELIENATAFSPPGSRVVLSGTRSRHGYSVTVTDHGVGFSAEDVAAKNALLATPDHESVAVTDMLGFLVVRRLANRFDLTVRLASQPGAGTVVTVEIPSTILMRDLQSVPSTPEPELEAADATAPGSSYPRQYLPAHSGPDLVHAAHHEVRSFAGNFAPAAAVTATPVTEPIAAAPISEPAAIEPLPAVLPPIPVQPAAAAYAAASSLTQRIPQANLAPQMRSGSVSPVLPGEAASAPAPEHARSLLSAYRTGLDLGRSGIMDSPELTPDRYAAPDGTTDQS
jgi:signal transduction histidine kinase